MAKTRCDSPLRNLQEDRQQQIIAWCLEPKTEECSGGYQHAREQLAADGIKVSITALSEFYSWFKLREFYEQAESHAEQQKQLMTEFDPANTDRAEKFADFCFIQEATKKRDAKTYVAVGQLRETRKHREAKSAHDSKALELQERRVAVLEAKVAKAVATLGDGKLSSSEREARMKEIFGIAG
jgi:hypothetical protein